MTSEVWSWQSRQDLGNFEVQLEGGKWEASWMKRRWPPESQFRSRWVQMILGVPGQLSPSHSHLAKEGSEFYGAF